MTSKNILTYTKPAHGDMAGFEWTGDYLQLKYAVKAGLLIMKETDTVSFVVKQGDKVIVHWTKEAGFLVGAEVATQVEYDWL